MCVPYGQPLQNSVERHYGMIMHLDRVRYKQVSMKLPVSVKPDETS